MTANVTKMCHSTRNNCFLSTEIRHALAPLSLSPLLSSLFSLPHSRSFYTRIICKSETELLLLQVAVLSFSPSSHLNASILPGTCGDMHARAAYSFIYNSKSRWMDRETRGRRDEGGEEPGRLFVFFRSLRSSGLNVILLKAAFRRGEAFSLWSSDEI